jgi:hypothetical protein
MLIDLQGFFRHAFPKAKPPLRPRAEVEVYPGMIRLLLN